MEVYKITNTINGKVYIGITTKGLDVRKKNHITKFNSGYRNHLYSAFEKYGLESFEWEVIDRATSDKELKDKEIFYVSKFNSYKSGYNSTPGGDFNPMDVVELRDKHNIIMNKTEHRQSASNKTREKWSNDPIYRENTLKGIREFSATEQYRNKQREISTGRKHTESDLIKMQQNNPNKKRVGMYYLGRLVKVFISLGDASRYIFNNMNPDNKCYKSVKSRLSYLCKGNKTGRDGYTWTYLTDETVETIEKQTA